MKTVEQIKERIIELRDKTKEVDRNNPDHPYIKGEMYRFYPPKAIINMLDDFLRWIDE